MTRINLLNLLQSMSDLSDNCSASVYLMGNNLFAAAPTCIFYEICPSNLSTVRKFDAKKLYGQNGYGVHPLQDENGDIWNMGFTVLPRFKYNIVKICAAKDGKEDSKFSNAKTICSIPSRWNTAFALNHR